MAEKMVIIPAYTIKALDIQTKTNTVENPEKLTYTTLR